MRFGKAQKALTFGLAVVSAAPLSLSGEIGFVFVPVFAMLCVAGWMIELPLTQNRRYRRMVTGAIIAFLLLQLARSVGGEPLAKMGIEFAVVLLGVKLCTRGSSADYQQIAMLSFLQVIASTIALNDLFYAACFLIFVALCPPVLALTHLRSEMEKRFGSDPTPESTMRQARALPRDRPCCGSPLPTGSHSSFPSRA